MSSPNCRRSRNGLAGIDPMCLNAFLLPRGAPDPGAPPCIRQRLLPATAGDLQGSPDRVLAPQRGLESIGPMLRGWLPVISSRTCATFLFWRATPKPVRAPCFLRRLAWGPLLRRRVASVKEQRCPTPPRVGPASRSRQSPGRLHHDTRTGPKARRGQVINSRSPQTRSCQSHSDRKIADVIVIKQPHSRLRPFLAAEGYHPATKRDF